jgi:putative DNA primase/helicase
MQQQVDFREFPLHALPDGLRAAVEEVRDHIKAPIPLIVAAALAPLSLACQGLFNVRRSTGLESPVSLFLFVIASSGERKSSVDNLFAKAVFDFEIQHQDAATEDLQTYARLHRIWKLQVQGIEKTIEKKSGSLTSVEKLKDALAALYEEEPKKPPPIPVLVYADATTEGLKQGLCDNVPSAGVMSSEAGIVLGGRAARDVPFFNQVWDGIPRLRVDRKKESYYVREPRLTMSLMAQPEVAREFFEKKGDQARDTGLLARMLISSPDSTQGTRFNQDGKAPQWNHLLAYHNRIRELLESYHANLREKKSKTTFDFTSEANQVCLRFYNNVESLISEGKILHTVRDHASKISENMARVAAIFHVFEKSEGPINVDATERAATVCQWYGLEFLRLFGEPNEISRQHALASQLLRDLVKFTKKFAPANYFSRKFLYQNCHPSIRRKAQLNIAISELEAKGLVFQWTNEEKLDVVAVTPLFFQQIQPEFTLATAITGPLQRRLEDGLVPEGVGNFNKGADAHYNAPSDPNRYKR